MTRRKIYFAQHGLAVDKTEDSERPLSPTGIAHSKKVAKILRDSGAAISHVFHSGKLRALQTADIYAAAINLSSTSMIEGLSPNDDVTILSQKLNLDNSLYVGHLPHLEKLIAYLITGDENTSIIAFQNSAVACLEKNSDNFKLRWYLTAELIK